MPSCVIPTMSPSLFQCLHSTHIVATIDFQTIFSNQILSVGVGLKSVCYSIPLHTIKSSVAVDLNFEPQKLKYCNMKGLWVFIYRVSQEECARLREGVPYVKVYRYNPKHLCPKLNGYGDNGQRSLKF